MRHGLDVAPAASERWRSGAGPRERPPSRAGGLGCRRLASPWTTAAVAARLARASGALVLHEQATTRLADLPLPTTGELVIVVGPEGGITDGELGRLAAATAVRLGPHILRTSTAGAAVLAALAPRLGRWT